MVRARYSHAWMVAALAFLGLQATGCSERTARVSGVVKLDDSPMKITDGQRGMVVFRPVAGGATCASLIDAEGTFSVATGASAGVTPGDYMVSVRVIELVPGEEEGQEASGQAITPALYANPLTSGLMYKVGSGENKLVIELDSMAGPAVLPPPVVEREGDEEADAAGGTEGEPAADEDAEREPEVEAEEPASPDQDLEQETEAEPSEEESIPSATVGDQ